MKIFSISLIVVVGILSSRAFLLSSSSANNHLRAYHATLDWVVEERDANGQIISSHRMEVLYSRDKAGNVYKGPKDLSAGPVKGPLPFLIVGKSGERYSLYVNQRRALLRDVGSERSERLPERSGQVDTTGLLPCVRTRLGGGDQVPGPGTSGSTCVASDWGELIVDHEAVLRSSNRQYHTRAKLVEFVPDAAARPEYFQIPQGFQIVDQRKR